MSAALQRLQALRLTGIMQALQDARQVPQELAFLRRTPIVPADDSEIMARFVGQVLIADLIADDAEAVTYSSDKLQYVSTSIPNLKLGRNLTQNQINKLVSIAMHGASARDEARVADWETRIIDRLLLGVWQRMEALVVAMHIDGFSYDRLGIKMSNVSWGMPSDLKATTAVAWDTAATATPVDDVLTMTLLGKVKYGVMYDRVTMSTTAFQKMIATTEFQAKARLYLAPNVSYTNLPQSDLTFQRTLAQNVLGMQVELYDARYWSQNANGSLTSAPFLPIPQVVLSSTMHDNDDSAMDFANGVVTESVVASLSNTAMVGDLGGPTEGPIAYATVPPTLNPPAITYWGVSRGFPRRHLAQATAVLTTGVYGDSISPVGEPF